MLRNLGSLGGHVVQTTTTMAVCWRMVTQAGATYGFTSCSRDLVIDGLTYRANSGMEPTAVEVNLGLGVDNSEVAGFILPSVMEARQLRAGLFDAAQVFKFVVDYTNPEGGQVKLEYGVLGEVQIQGTMFTAEIRGLSQWLASEVLPLTQATCRAIFGDPVQCKATVRTNTAAVTSVLNSKTFRASSLVGARADGFFDYGYLTWTSGDNNGLRMDVRHFDQATGELSLLADVVIPVAVGNTFTVREGCPKTRAACKTKMGPLGANNILNFDAEPDIPGNDIMLRIVRAQ